MDSEMLHLVVEFVHNSIQLEKNAIGGTPAPEHFPSVKRIIHGNLTILLKQCSGFVTFWYGPPIRISNPYHWLDPDPDIFFSSLQGANKNYFPFYCSFLTF
jgi:hypothetical protein